MTTATVDPTDCVGKFLNDSTFFSDIVNVVLGTMTTATVDPTDCVGKFLNDSTSFSDIVNVKFARLPWQQQLLTLQTVWVSS